MNLCPQWWHIMAKQATLNFLPEGVETLVNPQSIWYASPGPVTKRLPLFPCGSTRIRLAGIKVLCLAMYLFTVVRLPEYPELLIFS